MKILKKIMILSFGILVLHSCGKLVNGRTSDGTSLEYAARNDSALNSGTGACANGRKRIFVTASTINGNLGGISGADSFCMSDSNKPAGTSTFKAMIVDGASRVACTTAFCSGGVSENVNWVLAVSQSYYRTDCSTLISSTNTRALLTVGLTNPISASSLGAWTGMSSSWTPANSCSSWTSSLVGNNGDLGFSSYSNFGFINVGGASSPDTCNNNYHLYCVEQ